MSETQRPRPESSSSTSRRSSGPWRPMARSLLRSAQSWSTPISTTPRTSSYSEGQRWPMTPSTRDGTRPTPCFSRTTTRHSITSESARTTPTPCRMRSTTSSKRSAETRMSTTPSWSLSTSTSPVSERQPRRRRSRQELRLTRSTTPSFLLQRQTSTVLCTKRPCHTPRAPRQSVITRTPSTEQT